MLRYYCFKLGLKCNRLQQLVHMTTICFINRNIMKKFLCLAAFLTVITTCFSQAVKVVYDKTSPQAKYADERLEKALKAKSYAIRTSPGGYVITLSVDKNLGKEAYNISPNGKKISVSGGNGTGLIYGALSVCEDLGNGIKLQNIKASNDQPRMQLRAVKYDMPWDTYRHSYALDQHYETCRDLNYWRAFLDMMADNRLNALSLWDLHPFTYMIRAKNYPAPSRSRRSPPAPASGEIR